jgi:hypothetical protein
MGKDYRDDVAGCLEILDEGVDIWGGLVRGGAVVIYYLCIGLPFNGVLMSKRLIGFTRICILA